MDVKKKILFIVPSMKGGGSERVISLLVRYLDRSEFSIVLLLLKKEGIYLKDLPLDIEVIDLNASRLRQAILKLPIAIKKIKPDVVMSTLSHINIFIAMIRPFFSKNMTFIARESSIVSVNNQNTPYPHLFDWLYRRFFDNFDRIVCQSYYMKNDLIKNYSIDERLLAVIHNPVDIDHILKLSKSDKLLYDSKKVNLLAVGRLSGEKGFDLLLQSMVKLEKNFFLTIIGEGKEIEQLQYLTKKLKISNRVNFVGFQEKPYQYMVQADMLVLTSRYEGFPNVVLEANACGTPVVAFDCPGGTGEIIENGLNGFLVKCGDIKELAEAIEEASRYKWNKELIMQNISERYGLKKIIKQYQNLL